jgi:hypothetical protein
VSEKREAKGYLLSKLQLTGPIFRTSPGFWYGTGREHINLSLPLSTFLALKAKEKREAKDHLLFNKDLLSFGPA